MAVGMIRSVLSLCIITTLVATCLSYEQQHNSIADEEESSNGANDLANADLEKRSFSARLPSIGLRNRGGLQEQEKKSGTLLRFGRRDANAESEYDEEDDDEMERRAERGSASASGATLLRFGKRAPLLRFGKRAPLLRFGKRAPLLRFGKRPDTLLRFGRSQERPHRRYERPDVTLRFG